MHRALVSLSHLLVLSCATSAPRLVPYVVDGGDGAIVPTGLLRDTALELDCRPQLTAAGDWRCVPSSDWVGLAFADAGCTIPVVTGHAGASSPYYVDDAYGGGPATVYAVDVGAISSGDWFVDRGAAGCAPENNVSEVFAPAHVVGADAFVHGESRLEAHGNLAAHVFAGDDGTRVVVGAYDVAHGWDCNQLLYASGDLRCLPLGAAWRTGYYFGDAACTTEVAWQVPGATPTAVIDFAHHAGAALGVFEIGAPWSAGFRSSPCAAFDDGSHRFWEIGPAIPDTELPQLTPTEVGHGRLAAHVLAASDGSVVTHAGIFFTDRERGGRCAPAPLHGVVRCIDTLQAGDGGFSDAACTQPLWIGDATTRIRYDASGDGEALAVGAPYTGDVFWSDGTACTRHVPTPSERYFLPSTVVVSDDAFVILSTRTL